MKFIIILSVLINFNLRASFPDVDWPVKSAAEAGINSQKLDTAFQYAFSKDELHQTNALLVIKDGYLIKEEYANQTTAETAHRIWSCTKSFVGALFGIAFKKNLLTENTTIASFFHQLDKRLTVKDLLMMAGGLDWNEGYEGNPLFSQVIKMLYTTGFQDMATFVSRREQIYSPGKHFKYSSGDTNLLMGFLKEAIGKGPFHTFPWLQLFAPLKMKNVTWEMDSSGTYVGSSYLYMRARDLAKLGYLYLNNGKWNETQIIDEWYIKKSLQVNDAFLNTKLSGEANYQSYGLHWWLNVELPEKKGPRAYPDVPTDAFFSLGHHGQTMAVIPSKNLIIVRYGSDKKAPIDRNKLVKLVLDSVEVQ